MNQDLPERLKSVVGSEGAPGSGEVEGLKVGDLVTAGGTGGRVTSVRGDKIQVQFPDRPAFQFWFPAADVLLGAARPRPTPVAKRSGRKEATVEVRAVCKHVHIAALCRECKDE